MIPTSFVTKLLAYNTWANVRIGEWLLSLDRHLLHAPTGSSFDTIDKTLQHVWSGQEYWYDIMINGRIGDFNRPLREGVVDQVIEDLIASSKKLQAQLTQFTSDQWVERIQVSDSTQCRYEYIFHLVNHGTYHRGQIVSMSRALGVKGEIPVTDYDAYLWWIENKS